MVATGERWSALSESVLGATPREFESRILRSCDLHKPAMRHRRSQRWTTGPGAGPHAAAAGRQTSASDHPRPPHDCPRPVPAPRDCGHDAPSIPDWGNHSSACPVPGNPGGPCSGQPGRDGSAAAGCPAAGGGVRPPPWLAAAQLAPTGCRGGAWVAGFALMGLIVVAGWAWANSSTGAPDVAWGERAGRANGQACRPAHDRAGNAASPPRPDGRFAPADRAPAAGPVTSASPQRPPTGTRSSREARWGTPSRVPA